MPFLSLQQTIFFGERESFRMGLGISTGCTQTIPDDTNRHLEEAGLKETFRDWTVRDVNEALIETELRRERGSQARSYFETAQRLCPQIYEAQYNGALLSYRKGEFEISHSQLKSSLGAYPEHVDSGVLMNRLRKLLSEGT